MNGEYRTFIATLDEAISTASKENLVMCLYLQ